MVDLAKAGATAQPLGNRTSRGEEYERYGLEGGDGVPKAHVNGIDMWYQQQGNGPPLFQIHGAGLGHGNFAAIVPLLRDNFTIVDFDLRGYGETDAPAQDYSIELWADDVAALMDSLDIESSYVHGTSMGGMIALALAARHPGKVRGLVVSGCMARYDRAAVLNKSVWRRLVKECGMCDELVNLIAIQCLTREFLDSESGLGLLNEMRESLGNVSAETFIASSNVVENADLTSSLKQISAPTLVLVGEFDILTPLDSGPSGAGARRMAKEIPTSELVIVADAGHYILAENAADCATRINEFLGRVDQMEARGHVS